MTTEAKKLLADLKFDAEISMREFPQYRGHFAGYMLVRAQRTIRTKAGVHFVAGETTLARFEEPSIASLGKRSFLAWSFRHRCDVALSASDFGMVLS